MSAIVFRLLVYIIIAAALFWGLRRIWLDIKGQFKVQDEARRERDLKERDRPDVVELERDKDGIFRNPDDKNKPR